MNSIKIVNNLFKTSLIIALGLISNFAISEDGVTDSEILIGGVMDLHGDSAGLGTKMKAGIDAALKNQKIGNRSIRFVVENDNYSPAKTLVATQKLIDEKVFLFAGNVGTPTAKVSLPLLAEYGIPAVGFYTGAELLRPGIGDILNYRASYVQEIKSTIDTAIRYGVKPSAVCAFVQNDAYGMAGVTGIIQALESHDGTDQVVERLNNIRRVEGAEPARNGIGPVGVYTRNTLTARQGYDSLKKWELSQNTACKLVVTVGTYASIGRFIAYASQKGEPWVYSAVSFTGAGNLADTLARFGIDKGVIMTQVVPMPSVNAGDEFQVSVRPQQLILSAVNAAAAESGNEAKPIFVEGYIVGRMILHGLRALELEGEEITHKNFLDVFRGKILNIDGMILNFSDDNQGSDLVTMTTLSENIWSVMSVSHWRQLFAQ